MDDEYELADEDTGDDWLRGEDAQAHRKVYADIYMKVAESTTTDSDGATIQIGQWRAEEWLDPLFSSIFWHDDRLKKDRRSWGEVDSIGFRYRRWIHREAEELGEDLRALEIDGSELRGGVAEYLKHPEIHTDYLDWYCADTLAYMEWHGTVEQMQWYLFGLSGTLAISAGGVWPYVAVVWRLIWTVVKWAVWVAGLFFANEIVGFWGIVGLIALTALFQFFKWRRRLKVRDLINQMRAAYDVFQTKTFSWEVAWQELNRTRELGAVWPGELYKLVEVKK